MSTDITIVFHSGHGHTRKVAEASPAPQGAEALA